MKLARLLGSTAVVLTMAALPACAVEGTPEIGGYGTIYVDTVPTDIAVYPHVWYGDRYVYLVGDRWVAPYGRRWVALRGEPAPLFRYRTAYRPPPPAAVRPPPPAMRAPPPPRYGYPRP
jgi:hypothetical protein